MTESLAAATFYVGLALFVFGAIRTVRASVEHARRDNVGIGALVPGALAFSLAIVVFVHSAKGVLPF